MKTKLIAILMIFILVSCSPRPVGLVKERVYFTDFYEYKAEVIYYFHEDKTNYYAISHDPAFMMYTSDYKFDLVSGYQSKVITLKQLEMLGYKVLVEGKTDNGAQLFDRCGSCDVLRNFNQDNYDYVYIQFENNSDDTKYIIYSDSEFDYITTSKYIVTFQGKKYLLEEAIKKEVITMDKLIEIGLPYQKQRRS